MKILAVWFLLLGTSVAFAQVPDPRDSIILESKTVAPGAHPRSSIDTAAYFYIRVWITNKDSLTNLDLALVQKSISGRAWVELGLPRSAAGVYNRLTSTLGRTYECFGSYCYNSDSFLISGSYSSFATIEPPNLIRKPFWEIKFDSVLNGPGIAELDTAHVTIYILGVTSFVNTAHQFLRVNFVKSVITVVAKGDMNLDARLRTADLSLLLNCVMLGDAPPAGLSACDLNCDGENTIADLVPLLYAVFLGVTFPC